MHCRIVNVIDTLSSSLSGPLSLIKNIIQLFERDLSSSSVAGIWNRQVFFCERDSNMVWP